jgi:flagellar P-ring protein FlgI
MRNLRQILIVGLALCAFSSSVQAERLKDVADLQGVRPNILTGYGLVVGLAGTGDDRQSSVGVQSIINMMKKLGAQVHLDRLRLPNVAAVVVTAELPAYVQPGQKLDVTVSSLGSAKSIEGGTLIITPLKGADLKVYAVAQGAISVGGFSAGGQSGSSVSKNHTTVGRVPDGAIVERAIPLELTGSELAINLRRPDFTTAVRLSDAIDKVLQASQKIKEAKKAEQDKKSAESPSAEGKDETPASDTTSEPIRWSQAKDPGTVLVRVPQQYQDRIPVLMAVLENVQVSVDLPTIVVINERTGTVVLGDGVRISPVAIAHGGLTVEVTETPQVSQPEAFSEGETVIVPNSKIKATESQAYLHEVAPGASLGDVIKALNALGVSPRDLVAILQSLKTSGALRAKLVIQ